MPLEFSQYIDRRMTHVHLTISDSFLSEYPKFRSDCVLINDCTNDSVVVSIIEGDEITVFCFAVQNSGTAKFEITSETEMKYFTENLSSRLPSLIGSLSNQVMFDNGVQADHFREIGNRVDIIELTNKPFGKLFMVMFDSTIYFFQIDFENEVFCFKLPLWKLNRTTYDSDKRIPNLGRCFDLFRFFTGLKVYDDKVSFNIFSDVFNQGNYCVRASVTILFDDDTLEREVECSRTLISMGQYDDSPFTSGSEPEREETVFSDKTLKIGDEDSDEDSDEEDSDEEKVDPIIVFNLNDGKTIYCFERPDDDNNFFCIVFREKVVYLLQVDRDDLMRLKFSDSDILIETFDIDQFDFSKRLEGFGEVVGSCRIVMADPIKITCDFQNRSGNIVLTEQLIIENDELRET